jgi:hypothetical protein
MSPCGSLRIPGAERGLGGGTCGGAGAPRTVPPGVLPQADVEQLLTREDIVLRGPRLLKRIELAVLNRAEEGAPFTGRKEQDRTGLVLIVPDRYAPARQ